MSIVAMSVAENGVVFACDGLVTEPRTRAVVSYASKLQLLPQMGCILGFTGPGNFAQAIRFAMGNEVSDFDGMVRTLPGLARNVFDHMRRHDPGFNEEDAKFSLVIGGWSEERQRHEGYRLATYPKQSRQRDGSLITSAPWKLLPIAEGLWVSAELGDGPERVGYKDRPSLEIQQAVVLLVCAARAARTDSHNVKIGGFVQLAVLRGYSVSSSIVHRWPEDVVGKPVDPEAGELVPAWLEEAAPRRERS